MRISDWSSDVCSSDLQPVFVGDAEPAAGGRSLDDDFAALVFVLQVAAVVELLERPVEHPQRPLVQNVEVQGAGRAAARDKAEGRHVRGGAAIVDHALGDGEEIQLGRASCRERVCQYV